MNRDVQKIFALEARGLYKSYGNLKAVQDVNLLIPKGSCLALLGPNGAGKTTTLEILEGLTTPDRGEVWILGQNLATARRQIMERVGLTLQETNFYKRYTVYETIDMFAAFFAASLGADEIIKKLSLTEKRDCQLRHLSGGQKQRVSLGCALVNNPQLLFLDEPTTGLDPLARREIWDLIAELKSEGKSILLSTHYMEEAEVLADQVAIMNGGKIEIQGSPEDLINRVVGREVLQMECLEAPKLAVAKFAETFPWFQNPRYIPGGFEVALDRAAEKLGPFIHEAYQQGIGIKRVEVRRGTLDDVFLLLTGRSLRDE